MQFIRDFLIKLFGLSVQPVGKSPQFTQTLAEINRQATDLNQSITAHREAIAAALVVLGEEEVKALAAQTAALKLLA